MRVVASVAGIPLVHVAPPEIALAGPSSGVVGTADLPRDAIVLEHTLGDLDVQDLEPLLHVGSYSTYYEERGRGPAVKFSRLGDNSPEVLLRTVEPGRRYTVTYAAAPDRPVLFRGAEMTAFALSLAARRRGVLAHGCGVVLPGGSVALCLGVSGAGKSTLARMLGSLEDCRVLNDDRIVLTRDDGEIRAWSTPWPGSAGIAREGDGPLGVVALLGRGPRPVAIRRSGREALPGLLQTMLIPSWDEVAAGDAMAFLDELWRRVPIVELAYPLGEGVAARLRELLLRTTGE